nr:MAG TPA_asm: hypothetical protein [Caudoviricetes sp.]
MRQSVAILTLQPASSVSEGVCPVQWSEKRGDRVVL